MTISYALVRTDGASRLYWSEEENAWTLFQEATTRYPTREVALLAYVNSALSFIRISTQVLAEEDTSSTQYVLSRTTLGGVMEYVTINDTWDRDLMKAQAHPTRSLLQDRISQNPAANMTITPITTTRTLR